jgi:hypothetical protein
MKPDLVALAKKAAAIVLENEARTGHMTPTLAKNLLTMMDSIYIKLVEEALQADANPEEPNE